MISTDKSKFIRLAPYMEVIGLFTGLEEQNGMLLAEIARHIVVLPIELKDALTPHLGHRIAILHTDIPGKEYLFRVLPEKDIVKIAAMVHQGLGEDERTSNCSVVDGVS